ncbi:MAG: hypothetical protein WBP10_19885 [Thermoanaerobaculia bacterium]
MQRSIPLSVHQVQLLEDRARRIDSGLLEAIQQVSQRLGYRVYLVGGGPRDLFLSGRLGDLDLVVEGEGEEFARALAEVLGGTARMHSRFGTAELKGLGERLDIATARTERYGSPAALPEIEPGPLTEDLFRRDFSVNTLAIELGDGPPYEVLDSYNALEDMKDGRLRVLHDGSFTDDPTRIFRGIRFESRLGLRLDDAAERMARTAVADGAFDALSGDRLRREVFRLLEPVGSIESRLGRLGELGLLSILNPGLRLSGEDLIWIGRAATELESLPPDTAEVEGWRLVFPVLYGSLDQRAGEETADRLSIRPEDRDWLLGSRRDLDHAIEVLRRPSSKPHEIDRVLRPLRREQIALLLALGDPPVVQWTRRWLQELRSLSLTLTGQELVDAGCAPGPSIGRALVATREARLDGSITAEGELQFALSELKSESRKAGRE